MDIPELSMALSMSKVQQNWGIAMMANSLETLSDTGGAIAEMMDTSAMERSVTPNVGANIDLRV